MNYSELKITKDTLEYEIFGKTQKLKNNLTVKNFREQLKNLKYEGYYESIGGRNARDDALENFKMPAIVHTYYSLLILNGKIPTIDELCDNYIDTYIEKCGDKYQLKKEYRPNSRNILFSIESLKGRICRAYNSYHREVDLLLQLFEAYGNDYTFYYSFEEDYFNGVDIVAISKDGKRFDIATYFSSKRSLLFKKKKNEKLHEYKNISIDLLANFEGKEKNVIKVGDVKLYDDKAVKFIYSELTKNRAVA